MKGLITQVEDYHDAHMQTLWQVLSHRVQEQPLNLAFLIIFLLAILHTFFAYRFSILAERTEKKHAGVGVENPKYLFDEKALYGGVKIDFLRFFGEVEVVMGLWCIPLFILISIYYGWDTVLKYVRMEDYSEALSIIPLMAIASTYPLIRWGDNIIGFLERLFGNRVYTTWFILLTLVPLSGSLVKETVAMTFSAYLIGERFFRLKPSTALKYATLALLFTNVALGGLLTTYGSSAILVVKKIWGWDSSYMFHTFGLKALLAILISTSIYFIIFRKELLRMKPLPPQKKEEVPLWISLVHVAVLAFVIAFSDELVLSLGAFVLFLGFYQATALYQSYMNLRAPILVAFFLSALVIHGGLQGWWAEAIVNHSTKAALAFGATLISSITNNTVIAYLASRIPQTHEEVKVLLFGAIMSGAGLTLVANAPNLIGYSLLSPYFEKELSPIRLLAWALLPAFISSLIFYLGTFF